MQRWAWAALCAGCLIFTCDLALAAKPAGLNGWRGYKFGMTAAQVRAVPGIKWQEGDPGSQMFWRAAKPASEGGLSFTVDARFDASVLSEISLLTFSKSASFDVCELKFLHVLAGLEKTYGVFQPKTAEGLNQPNPGAGYEESNDTVWKQAGASKYDARILRERSSPEASWLTARVAEASREIGGHEVFVNGYQEDGYDNECDIRIVYRAAVH